MKSTDQMCSSYAMQLITNISKSTALRRIADCKEALGKQRHEILTVGEFCGYYGLNTSGIK